LPREFGRVIKSSFISFDKLADIIRSNPYQAGNGASALEKTVIHRRGSYLVARAYLKLVVAVTVVYAALAVTLAVISELKIHNITTGFIVFALGLGPVVAIWMVYLIALRVFKLESRRSVELTDEGIREARDGRELKFIPWAAVKEIEVDATIGAGASLRMISAFTEIVISNVDLVITEPTGIRNAHRAMGGINRMRKLFADVRAAAPRAELKMNQFARRRMKEYEWIAGEGATRGRGDAATRR
jgi:hypothetical protein